MAGMAVVYVAGYLIEERRRWPVITASSRGKCSKYIQNFEGKACSDEKTLPVTCSGLKTHPTILPRSGIELTTSRTPVASNMVKVSHALNHSAMENIVLVRKQ